MFNENVENLPSPQEPCFFLGLKLGDVANGTSIHFENILLTVLYNTFGKQYHSLYVIFKKYNNIQRIL